MVIPLWYDFIFGEYPIPDSFLVHELAHQEEKPAPLEEEVESVTPTESAIEKGLEGTNANNSDYYGFSGQKYILNRDGTLKLRK